MAFTHIWPGGVRTPMSLPPSIWYKPLYPLIYLVTVSMEESAEYMLHALFSGENGVFRRGPKGNLLKNDGWFSGYWSTQEAKEKLWAHTEEATRVL